MLRQVATVVFMRMMAIAMSHKLVLPAPIQPIVVVCFIGSFS
jgi:hypothetical protein